jgi:ribonuclease P protein component
MLPKKNRLTKKKDFEAVFNNGQSVKNGFLLIKILTVPSTSKDSRFGFVVSKKISAKATVRNTIKRVLRVAAASLLKNLTKKVDVVIIVLPGVKKDQFPELKDSLEHSFKKIKLIT